MSEHHSSDPLSSDVANDDLPLLLVVDDQLHNALIIEHLLSEFSIRVDCAETGAAALQMMSEMQPNLVLLDMDMPDCDGYNLLNQMQANANICHIPVILMQPNLANHKAVAHDALAGALDTLAKPIDIDALKHLINLFQFTEVARKEIAELHNNNEALLDSKDEGILGINGQGRIVYVNNAGSRLLKTKPSQLIGLYVESLFEDPADNVVSQWDEHPVNVICRGKGSILQVEKSEFWQGDGEQLPVKFAAVPAPEHMDSIAVVIAFRALNAEDDKAYRAHARAAKRDTLTRLPNREGLMEALTSAISEAQVRHQPLTVFHVDLDHFQNMNEAAGHAVGDELLCVAATRLRSILRQQDILARLTSDEFVIAIAGLDGQQSEAAVAHKINAQMKTPFLVRGHELYLSASVGIATYPHAGSDAGVLVHHAELATRRTKEMGRNSYQFYNVRDNAELVRRMQLEHELHEAMRRKQLDVEFFPVTHLGDQCTEIFSVALSWAHPRLGKLSRLDFQDVAEEAGLLNDLTQWALDSALAKIENDLRDTKWWNRVKLSFAINPRALLDVNFATHLKAKLDCYGFNPHQIILEIPEQFISVRAQGPHEQLAALRKMGVSLVITDFGAHFGPLNLVTLGKFDYLKFSPKYLCEIINQPNGVDFLNQLILLLKAQDLVLWTSEQVIFETLGSLVPWLDLCTEASLKDTLETLSFEEVLELRCTDLGDGRSLPSTGIDTLLK